MLCTVQFPPVWVDTIKLDVALSKSGGPHSPQYNSATFMFPADCKIMIDAALRLQSVVNQLLYAGKSVCLVFDGQSDSSVGYLNRMGFFDHLDSSVEVLPSKPESSTAQIFRGTNSDLVEIVSIGPNNKDRSVPGRMSEALSAKLTHLTNPGSFQMGSFTILSELIGNIYRHSSLELNGFAALQTYRKSNLVKIAVSDSGPGIIETLRPVLVTEYPKLIHLTDSQLMKEIFRKGLSRFGEGNGGSGLKGCGNWAIKFNASIEVRQNCSRFNILTANNKMKAIQTVDNLPFIWGTHTCFNFSVDLTP